MKRFIPQALFLFFFSIFFTAGMSATTYYIAANGSDSNSGTSNTSPWQHAPGMPNCTATCGKTTPQPGDKFIFRGGDTWHFGDTSASTYVGGNWSWTWAGSSTNCQIDPSNGSVVLTSCIYIGVDTSFYSGSSWVRPIMNMDNPLSTNFVSGCRYNDDGLNNWFIRASYIQVDNLEFTGQCTSAGGSMVDVLASFVDFTYDYFHGWTIVTGNAANGSHLINCNGSGCTGFVKLDHSVMDGSDSSGAATAYTGAMNGMGACTDVEYSIIRYVGNFCVDGSGNTATGAHIFHDNLFEYLYNPSGGHGNVIEMTSGVGNAQSNGPVYFYNNTTRHTDEGVTYDLIPNSGGSVYISNNVFYDIANGANCLGPNGNGAASAINVYIYNNTFDYQNNVQGNTNGGCKVAAGAPIKVNFQNNHFINYPSNSISAVWNGTGSANDNGNEVWQSESAANAQGYTASNGYAPPAECGSSTCSTIGAGNNNYTLVPVVTPSSLAYGSGTSAGVVEVSYGGGYGVNSPAAATNPRQMTAGGCTAGTAGCWDAGAYQFSSAAGQLNPPTGLSAQVQ
jgi:hypothetical protein